MKERIEELANQIINMPPMNWDEAVVKRVVTTAVNEALEMAAKECEKIPDVEAMPGCYRPATPTNCAEAIRKLKEQS